MKKKLEKLYKKTLKFCKRNMPLVDFLVGIATLVAFLFLK